MRQASACEDIPENVLECLKEAEKKYLEEIPLPPEYEPGDQVDIDIRTDKTPNDEIDEMRHSATAALMDYKDVIVVASVSCIYGIGEIEEYRNKMLTLNIGQTIDREEIIEKLIEMLYERNDMDLVRGTFRARGDTIEVVPAYSKSKGYRIDLFGDEVEGIDYFIAKKILRKFEQLNIAYIKDEIDGFVAFLDKTFGKGKMKECSEYVLRLKKLG